MNERLELFKDLRRQGWGLTRINLFMAKAVNADKKCPWTPQQIALLRQYWARGYSINYIGIMIGVSRNSVVGKVRRLKLPPRVSPFPKRMSRAKEDSKIDAPASARDREIADRAVASSSLADSDDVRDPPVQTVD